MGRFSITVAMLVALSGATIARADETPVDPVSIELSLANRRPYPMRRPRYHEASLVRFLRHDDATVRRNALRDLVHNFDTTDPVIHAAISALLDDRDPEVRSAATEALGLDVPAPTEGRPERAEATLQRHEAPPAAQAPQRQAPSIENVAGADARARIAGMLDGIRSGCIDFAVNSALVRFEALYRAERYPDAAESLERAASAQTQCKVPNDNGARTRLMSYQGKIQARLAGILASWQDEKVDELLRLMSERAALADYAAADEAIFRIERYQSVMSSLATRLKAVERGSTRGRARDALAEMRDVAADGDIAAVERILSKVERYLELISGYEQALAALRASSNDEIVAARLADAEQAAFDGRASDMDRIIASLELYQRTMASRADRIAALRAGWRDARVDRLLTDIEQAALRGEGGAIDMALSRIAHYVELMGPQNERVAMIRAGHVDQRVESLLSRAAELTAHGEQDQAKERLAEIESYQALRIRLAAALERRASDPIEAKLVARLEEMASQDDPRRAEKELAKLEKHRETKQQIQSRLAHVKSGDQDAFRANWILVCEKSLEEGNLAGANKALAMVDDRA